MTPPHADICRERALSATRRIELPPLPSFERLQRKLRRLLGGSAGKEPEGEEEAEAREDFREEPPTSSPSPPPSGLGGRLSTGGGHGGSARGAEWSAMEEQAVDDAEEEELDIGDFV